MPPFFDKEKQYQIQAVAASSAIRTYTDYFQKLLNCHAGPDNVKGKVWTKDHHKFIPSSNSLTVISCLRLVRNYIEDKHHSSRYDVIRLLDCGCGVGNILLLARGLGGFRVTGLEYEPEAVEIAKRLIGSYGTILRQDILTYDSYVLYDVIYYYQPISNTEKMIEFTTKAHNDMKVGAVVITYGGGSHTLRDDKRFKAIFSKYSSVPENIRRMAWEKVKE